jgi:hypothetical protein
MPLAACFDSGPTEAEARAAYVAHPVSGGVDNYEKFKLLGCKEAVGAPGYQCDLTYSFTGGAAHPDSGRFFKAGDKWVFAKDPARR